MAKTLKEKTARGLVWSFLEKFGQQFLFLLSGVILTRILSPEDYGLVAILGIFIAIANTLIDSGFNRGLLNKKEITQIDYNTVFYFNITIAFLLYLLIYLFAPLIATFFHNEKLTLLSRIIFLAIPFNAFSSIQTIILWKSLDMKKLSLTTLLALTIASITAVLLAIQGLGYWAIVAQTLLLSFCRSLFLWVSGSWLPTRSFDFKVLKELFPFGSKLLLSGLLNSIFNNIQVFIIGRLFPIHDVGYYDRGYKYQTMCMNSIAQTFRSVIIPVYAEVKDDNKRLQRVMSRMIQSTAFICIPLMLFLIIVAKPLLVILISDKWLPSVPIFQILCLGGLFNTFDFAFGEAIIAKGRSDIFLTLEFGKKLILVAILFAVAPFGIIGYAWSIPIYSIFNLGIGLYLAQKIIHYKYSQFMKDVIPYILLSILIMTATYFVGNCFQNNWLILITTSTTAIIGYIGLAIILKLNVIDDLNVWIQKFKN